jgi:hypothetical protein
MSDFITLKPTRKPAGLTKMSHFIALKSTGKAAVILPILGLLILGIVVSITCLEYYLMSYDIPQGTHIALWGLLTLIPNMWFWFWKNTRVCFVLSTFILLLTDQAPFIGVPIAIACSFPNFLYLLHKHRHSHIRYFVFPYLFLSIYYIFTSIFLNFISKSIVISYVISVDIGIWGVFGGTVLVYYLMYFPLALYHFARYDQKFFSSYIFAFSIFINLICLVGIFQGLHGTVRVNSIMRKTTRLAPLLVIALPIFIKAFFKETGNKQRIYWGSTLIICIITLLLTSTRAALGPAAVLWGLLAASLLTSKSYRPFWMLIASTAFLAVIAYIASIFFNIDYLARFSDEGLEQGFQLRFTKVSLYLDWISSQNISSWETFLHTLFGYGWFSERAILDPHNTFITCFSCFGLLGMVFYYVPYLWFLLLSLKQMFTASDFSTRPQYAMACGLMILFIFSGAVHNKMYSGIESSFTWLLIGLLLQGELLNIFPLQKATSAKPSQNITLNSKNTLRKLFSPHNLLGGRS